MSYTPTAGMLAALVDGQSATPLDYLRCRLRGLTDVRDWPTVAGRACLQRELRRRKDLGQC